jgi:hypothetical protein
MEQHHISIPRHQTPNSATTFGNTPRRRYRAMAIVALVGAVGILPFEPAFSQPTENTNSQLERSDQTPHQATPDAITDEDAPPFLIFPGSKGTSGFYIGSFEDLQRAQTATYFLYFEDMPPLLRQAFQNFAEALGKKARCANSKS